MRFGGPKRPPRLVTEAHQSFSFTRRTLALGAMQGGVGLLLAGRMAWLTIAEKDRYTALAESNRARSTMIPPQRGWMIDRVGQPIAINRSDFRVDLIPDLMEDRDAEITLLQHILGLAPCKTGFYNLGNGDGYSVKQVIEMCEKITGKKIPAIEKPRRPGDPPKLVASAEKAIRELGWKPKFPKLEDIVATAWAWHKKNPNGYRD